MSSARAAPALSFSASFFSHSLFQLHLFKLKADTDVSRMAALLVASRAWRATRVVTSENLGLVTKETLETLEEAHLAVSTPPSSVRGSPLLSRSYSSGWTPLQETADMDDSRSGRESMRLNRASSSSNFGPASVGGASGTPGGTPRSTRSDLSRRDQLMMESGDYAHYSLGAAAAPSPPPKPAARDPFALDDWSAPVAPASAPPPLPPKPAFAVSAQAPPSSLGPPEHDWMAAMGAIGTSDPQPVDPFAPPPASTRPAAPPAASDPFASAPWGAMPASVSTNPF